MTPTQSIVYAMLAMLILVFMVLLALGKTRRTNAKAKHLSPQKAQATSENRAAGGDSTQSRQLSDNLRNLFEMPVLFYALCTSMLATQTTTAWMIKGIWLYVFLRYVHSYIHCTYNKVWHRFFVFLLSTLVLLVLWVGFALQVV